MNQKILITGAGGSIGSGLVKKLIQHGYHNLVLIDNSEFLLFSIVHQLNYQYKYYLADIRDKERLKEIFEKEKSEIIFHTAALKHVPLLEKNPQEAIKTNIFGTLNLVELAKEYSIRKFIFISSDKAIKPTSVMGASKRIGEMICQYYKNFSNSIYVSVRFGNVLGSSGSVIPIFKEQIERGGPVTVTDPNMKRFFMSIDQACELLISTMEIAQRDDDIFFLNMGEPINIYELAKYMILSYGKMPNKDIEIKITGLRPGEKLYEEIYDKKDETIKPTSIQGIQKVVLNGVPYNFIHILNQLFEAKDTETIKKYIKQLIPDFPLNNNKKN